MPGPGGGFLSTWRDKRDGNSSKKYIDNYKKDDNSSKKDDEQFHPWLVENKVKKDNNMAKKEDTGSLSKGKIPGPGEEPPFGTKASGRQKNMVGKEKS